MKLSAFLRVIALGGAVFASACQANLSDIDTASIETGDGVRSELESGKMHYRSGNYGLAQKHFVEARDGDPFNAEAWLGLAAAYDQLGRFDLADRAYRQTEALIGPAPQLLNNIGYSHLLRGDAETAAGYLARARAALPSNLTVAGNSSILDSM